MLRIRIRTLILKRIPRIHCSFNSAVTIIAGMKKLMLRNKTLKNHCQPSVIAGYHDAYQFDFLSNKDQNDDLHQEYSGDIGLTTISKIIERITYWNALGMLFHQNLMWNDKETC